MVSFFLGVRYFFSIFTYYSLGGRVRKSRAQKKGKLPTGEGQFNVFVFRRSLG